MTAKILFVDDEAKILQGLRRMLRSMRHEWDMAFANSGAEALEVLDQSPVDAIVSDMRMPNMDGGQLLSEVQRRHPRVIRFVLSGQCEEETMFRLVSNSHQFLSKPCDSDRLIRTLQRALGLRDLLANRELQTLVSGLGAVPSPGRTHDVLARELQADAPSLQRIADFMTRDTALAAKILQLSNSAYFGIGKSVTAPSQAVKMLGIDTIKALVLTHGVVPRVDGNGPYDRIWEHGLTCARMARAIAEYEGLAEAAVDNAGVGGLLHDIGALLLAARHPDKYADIIGVTSQETGGRLEIERRTFGTTHTEIGAYLLGLWGLPDEVVEAVAYHHDPRAGTGTGFTVLSAVHLAEGLTQIVQYGESPEAAIDHQYLAEIGLAERLPAWLELCDALAVKAA